MSRVSKKLGRPFVSCPLALTWEFRCRPLPLKLFLQPHCDDDLRYKRKTTPKEGKHLKWRKVFAQRKKELGDAPQQVFICCFQMFYPVLLLNHFSQ